MTLPIHVAALQYSTDAATRIENTDKVLHLLDDAAHTSDLVLLPEISFSAYNVGGSMREVAEPMPGPLTSIVSQIAVNRNAFICFGMAELDGDSMYNTAVLVSADGSIAGTHRKAHLYKVDTEAGFSPGNQLSVFETHLGKIGILICCDVFHIESIRVLDLQGAQMVLVPSVAMSDPDLVQATVRSWEIVLQANARYGRCHIVWADKIGTEGGLACIGNSMVLDSDGEIVARADMQEEVVRAEVHLEPKYSVPSRRPELYRPLAA